MLKMMRSKGIISPWYNEYYSKYVIDILKFDDYTYAVKIPYAKPDPIMHTAVTPKPYHFYGNLRTEVKLKSRDKRCGLKQTMMAILLFINNKS